MSETIEFREPTELFKVDPQIQKKVGRIVSGHNLSIDSRRIPVTEPGFIYGLSAETGGTIKDGMRLFRIVSPLIDQIEATVGNNIGSFSADCREANPGTNPRGIDWHSDRRSAVIVPDILPTQVVVGSITKSSYVAQHYERRFDGPRVSLSFDRAVNRAIETGDLSVITLETSKAYLIEDQIHRPFANNTNHPVKRSFLRLTI